MNVKLYLASPLGFAHSTRVYMLELEKALAHADVAVVNPWDDFEVTQALRAAKAIIERGARIAALAQVNAAIGTKNERAIRECDRLVAVLDGVDVDSGTAAEVGFAYALGKRVDGLRTDVRLSGDNEGSVVNLQVQYFIEASGGRIAARHEELLELLAST